MPDAAALPKRIPHVPRNFALNVADGAVFALGMAFASRTTVLPLFVQKLGGGSVAVGLIPVVWTIGFNFPQLAIAPYAARLVKKKPLVLTTGVVQRLPWLLLAIAAFWVFGPMPAPAALAVFFGLFAMAAVGGSLNLPGWFDLVAKLTPVRLRGRLFAWRAVLGAVLGIGAGWLVERVLDLFPAPQSFGVLFALAFATTVVSYGLLAQVREPMRSVPRRPQPYGHFLRQLPALLRADRNFRRFLVADGLLIAATMADAFYAVYALERFALAEGWVGRFLVVTTATAAVASLAFGYVADRWGHRLNLVLAAGATVVACAVALTAPTPGAYLVVFVGSLLALGLPMISRLPLVAELCSEAERPTYVALMNTVTAPFALSALAGGWLAARLGYPVVFWAGGAAALAAAAWLLVAVREPRALPPPGTTVSS